MKYTFMFFLLTMTINIFAQYDLTIRVNGLENKKGHIILDLFESETGYPMKTQNAVLRKKVAIPPDGPPVIHITGLRSGIYAVALIHDVNDNNLLDLNFLGIPKEGAGASNDARGFMSPPAWKDAKFTLQKSMMMDVKMDYFYRFG
ncbi:MAG: DUF2141 domain-containing protein [Saprospiraceae bacterium]|nr:DUF2141 domain-containing protein [Saprospiraceae bacterium]